MQNHARPEAVRNPKPGTLPGEDASPLDRAAFNAELIEAAGRWHLALDEKQRGKLLHYICLLVRWNATYNLTAVRDPHEMLVLHLLDSLSIAPLVAALAAHSGGTRLLDVGSGAGLPGIPLAIALPRLRVDLVDAVQKKVAFLTHVKGSLDLSNVHPHHQRVEALTLNERPNLVVSRAFSDIGKLLGTVSALLADEGVVLAMKGQVPESELLALPPGWRVDEVVPLAVPGLDAARCVVVLRRMAN